MARVKGREVVVDLLDAVAALEKTTALHATQLSELAALAVETSARVHGLTGQTASLTRGFSELSRRMDDMSTRMDALTTQLVELEAGLTTQAENLLVAAKTVHQQQEQLGRVGRLLTTLASGNDDRFEEIEARLTVLEKKAS